MPMDAVTLQGKMNLLRTTHQNSATVVADQAALVTATLADTNTMDVTEQAETGILIPGALTNSHFTNAMNLLINRAQGLSAATVSACVAAAAPLAR
jgi:hypothetical protein